MTDADGHSTTNVYDALNRQVQVKYQDGTASETVYDADGRTVAQTNQDGVETTFAYDGAGRLIAVTNAQGQVTQYQYDEAGNEIAQIDALGRTNTFTYDPAGRKTSHTLPSGGSEGYGYDSDGNQVNYMVDGYTLVSQYDSMNRLISRSVSDYENSYSSSQSFAYTLTGQRQSMTANSHNFSGIAETDSYDRRDRLVQKAVLWQTYGGESPSALLSYGYDSDGNLTNIDSGFANGVHLTYAYDPLNRLTNVLSHGQMAAAYSYDLADNLTAMQYGNGVTNGYQYDSLNRLTNLVCNYGDSPRASFFYQLMPGGTRTNLMETNAVAWAAYQWTYDNLYRLTNETISGVGVSGNVAYAYDSVGNRTNRLSTGSTQFRTLLPTDGYSYDTNDENLLTTDDSGNSTTNDYDGRGDTIETTAIMVTNLYNYSSCLSQLVSAAVNGTTIFGIGYDSDGNRVFKDVQTPDGSQDTVTFYLVDDRNPSGYPQVVEEYQGVWDNNNRVWDSPVALSQAYNYGLNLISQQRFDPNTLLPSELSYYGYDGHGSVRFLMDTNGSITDTYRYDAFGNLIASNEVTPNNYLYCGQQWDPDLGLYYNRARYMAPGIGRFMTMDTFAGNNEDPLSLHKYLYAADDPVDGSDPSGNDDIDDVVATEYLANLGRFGGIRFSGIPYVNASSRNTSGRYGALIVGFLGFEPWGWLGRNDGNKNMRQMAQDIEAPIFPSADIGQAYNYILSCFRTGSGGTQAGEPIRIFGYSWGGTSAIKLARWIGRSGLEQNSEIDLFTLDPVSIGRFPPTSVNSNVTYFWNRYETAGNDTKPIPGIGIPHGEYVTSSAKKTDEENVNSSNPEGIGHTGITDLGPPGYGGALETELIFGPQ